MSGQLIDRNSKFNSKGLAITDTACHQDVAVQDLTARDLLRIRKRTVLRHRSDRSAGMRVCLGFSARNRDGDALHEINVTLERKDINDKHKAMILKRQEILQFSSERFSLLHRRSEPSD